MDQLRLIHWIQTAEPPKKKPKCGQEPITLQKVNELTVVVFDASDSEQENKQPMELQPGADVDAMKTRHSDRGYCLLLVQQ